MQKSLGIYHKTVANLQFDIRNSRIGFSFYRLPQGKSRLGRDQLTSSSSGDSFAAPHAMLPFMLCYAMTIRNNLIIFYRLSTDLLAILGLRITLD